MGVIGFAEADLEAVAAHDEQVGDEFDRHRRELGLAAEAAPARA